jgi:hypothetical protein
MICLKCDSDTKCTDSRDHGDYIRRRRKCKVCGFRYTTKERVLLEPEEKQSLLLDGFVRVYGKSINRKTLDCKDLRAFGIQLLKAYEEERGILGEFKLNE